MSLRLKADLYFNSHVLLTALHDDSCTISIYYLPLTSHLVQSRDVGHQLYHNTLHWFDCMMICFSISQSVIV